MGIFLVHSDLAPIAPKLTVDEANIYIDDVEASAVVEAPCIIDADFPHTDAVKGILRQAVLRWHRAGDGSLSSEQQSAGPFQHTLAFDSRTRGEGRLLAGEVHRLRALCRQWKASTGGRKAFSVMPE